MLQTKRVTRHDDDTAHGACWSFACRAWATFLLDFAGAAILNRFRLSLNGRVTALGPTI
jgi:hypothetical protein